MDIVLTSNSQMKLLNKKFIHVQPPGKEDVQRGGKYNAICTEYGPLGQIECLRQWKQPICEVSDIVTLLAEDMESFRQYVEKHKLMQLDLVQVCVLRFIRRNDNDFFKLLKAETTRQGLPFFQQQSMFP